MRRFPLVALLLAAALPAQRLAVTADTTEFT